MQLTSNKVILCFTSQMKEKWLFKLIIKFKLAIINQSVMKYFI